MSQRSCRGRRLCLVILLITCGGFCAAATAPPVPVVEEPEPEPPRRRPIFIPIVGDELLLYRDRRRRYTEYNELSLPGGGYWRHESYYLAPGGLYRYDPYYMWYPYGGPGPTRVVVGAGTGERGSLRYYYLYEPAPPAYGPYYAPGDMGAGYVRLETPTVRRPGPPQVEGPPEGEGEEAEPEAPPAPTAGFGSRLSPMLGGPRRVGIAFALGEAKLRSGEYEEAAEAFGQPGAGAPGPAARSLALSLALLGAGDYENAARALREGLSALPEGAVLDFDPARAFGTAEAYEAAMAPLRAAAGEDPGEVALHLLLGFQPYAAGRYEEAAELFWQGRDAGIRDPLLDRLILESQRRAFGEAPQGEEE